MGAHESQAVEQFFIHTPPVPHSATDAMSRARRMSNAGEATALETLPSTMRGSEVEVDDVITRLQASIQRLCHTFGQSAEETTRLLAVVEDMLRARDLTVPFIAEETVRMMHACGKDPTDPAVLMQRSNVWYRVEKRVMTEAREAVHGAIIAKHRTHDTIGKEAAVMAAATITPSVSTSEAVLDMQRAARESVLKARRKRTGVQVTPAGSAWRAMTAGTQGTSVRTGSLVEAAPPTPVSGPSLVDVAAACMPTDATEVRRQKKHRKAFGLKMTKARDEWARSKTQQTAIKMVSRDEEVVLTALLFGGAEEVDEDTPAALRPALAFPNAFQVGTALLDTRVVLPSYCKAAEEDDAGSGSGIVDDDELIGDAMDGTKRLFKRHVFADGDICVRCKCFIRADLVSLDDLNNMVTFFMLDQVLSMSEEKQALTARTVTHKWITKATLAHRGFFQVAPPKDTRFAVEFVSEQWRGMLTHIRLFKDKYKHVVAGRTPPAAGSGAHSDAPRRAPCAPAHMQSGILDLVVTPPPTSVQDYMDADAVILTDMGYGK